MLELEIVLVQEERQHQRVL